MRSQPRSDITAKTPPFTPTQGAYLAFIRDYIAKYHVAPAESDIARQLMEHDALGAHARDELGISEQQRAKPVVAALASAATFAVGAALPLVVVWLTPPSALAVTVVATSLACLATLGAVAARVGGAKPVPGAIRVTFWGAFAMALTYGVGAMFGAVV